MATEGSGFVSPGGVDHPPTFNLVRRGFDPDQVVAYLRVAAQRVQALETRARDLEKERDEARRERDIALEAWEAAKESRSDPYEAVSAHLAELMRMFDREVEKLRQDAQAEADRILAQARSEAERLHLEAQGAEAEARAEAEGIVHQAREEAERIVGRARSEAERMREDLSTVHASTLNDLRIIRDHMANSIRELAAVLGGEQVVVVGEAEEPAGSAGADEALPLRPEAPSGLGS